MAAEPDLRIAFHAPRASHLTPGESGDKVFVRTLLAELRARGHEIEIVSRVNARDFWRGHLPARRLITEAISVRRAMKQFAPDAWLVYGASVKNPDLFGWWQRPKRYVLLNTYVGSGSELGWWWRWLFALAYRRSLARADTIAAERPKNADDLRALGLSAERLRIFPPAVDTCDWVPSREEARRRLGLPQQAPIILCVSRLSAPRNDAKPWKTEWVLDLLNAVALAALPTDVLFVVVGDGPGRQRVETKIAELELRARVRLVGSVPHEDVRWFYGACDLYAYPDMRDRMFNTILEAQACGRAVLTTHTRSSSLTVDAGRTGLLAKDLEEFQALLSELVKDRPRCEEMGKAGPAYIARFHSIETRVSQIEDLLRCGT